MSYNTRETSEIRVSGKIDRIDLTRDTLLIGTRDHDIPLVKEEQRFPLPAYDIS